MPPPSEFEQKNSAQKPVPTQWQEQLKNIRPLVAENTAGVPPINNNVEFITLQKEDAPDTVDSETKGQQQQDLQNASRGHIQFQRDTPPLSRDFDTPNARADLLKDMGERKIDVLPENPQQKDSLQISQDEAREFAAILEQGFADEREGEPVEKNPADVKIAEIREKIEKTANLIEEKVQNKEYDEFLGNELGFAVKDLAERLHGTMQRRESVPKEETEGALKELLEESATLGSDEWVARFTTKEENKKIETPAPQTTEASPKGISAAPIEETWPSLQTKTEVQEIAPKKELREMAEQEVAAQFQKDFAMAQEDLKGIITKVETPEGEKTVRFSDITPGQQLLLLEHLKDFALDNAKEQALKHFTEEEKEKYGNAGCIKKAFLSYTKSYRRAADMTQIEKDILEKPELDKGTYAEVLQEMLGQASEAPEAEWKDGKLQINFVSEKDFQDTPDAKEKVKEYNDIIARFVGIPHEWAYSKNEKEQKQYQEAKESYAKARTELGWLAYEQEKEGGDALSFTASLDKKVQFSQLFSTHPDVEKAFAETKDQKAWLEGVKAIAKEKGTLMALGRGLSTLGAGVAVSVGSGFAAPIAVALAGGFLGGSASGGILGWLMARKRARQEIEDKKKLAEIGVLDASNEKEFRAAHEEKEGVEVGVGLADKLEYAVGRVLGAETEEEKEQLLKVLADRMHYTEKKISMDVVSFGEGAEGFRGRYELLSALAKAETLFGMSNPETNKKVEKKIDELLGTEEKRIAGAERNYESEKVRQGIKYGIILGGTFGTLLSSIAYAHAHGGAVADTQPAIPATSSTNSTPAETVLPNTITLPKNTLADDILNKFKFQKNYELPAAPTQPAVVAESAHTAAVGHEGVLIPEAVKIPENILPQPKLGFSANNEGTIIPGAVKIPENFFQTPATHLAPNTAGHEETFIPKDGWMFGPKGSPSTHGVAETLTPRQLAIEHSFQELGKTYTVKAGDNVWNIIKMKLGGNEDFAKLPPREQNFIIDSIKDRVVKMSPTELREIGIKGDPSRIYAGDELRLGKVFNNSDELMKIFTRAEHTSVTPSAPAAVTEAVHQITPPPATPVETIHHVAPAEVVHHTTIAKEPVPPIHEKPITLAQNDDVTTDVTPPIQPRALPVHEIVPPITTTGHFEAFSARIQNIPAYTDYKSMVYNEIHMRHPEINLPVYDMKMRDFLAQNPNGLEELKRVFHMKGVETPAKLPEETMNGSVLDYWTRQVVQDDFNQHGVSAAHNIAQQIPVQQNAPRQETRAPIYDETARRIQQDAIDTKIMENQGAQETFINTHAPGAMVDPYMVPREQIPPQYTQWAQQGMAQQYPNVPPQFYQQRMVDMMAKDGYNQTTDTVNRMSQLFGIRTPIQLSHIHSNDTPIDLIARMAWRTAQGSGHLPPNFPNLPYVFGTFGRFASPNPTDQSIGASDVSTMINQGIGNIFTSARIHSSGVTHK